MGLDVLHVTRRVFGQWLASAVSVLGLVAIVRPLDGHAMPPTSPISSERMLDGPLLALTLHEAKTLDEVAALLIPTDQDPGAREAQVVIAIDRLLSRHSDGLALYQQGVAWLDLKAAELGQVGFLALPIEKRIQVLQQAESGQSSSLQRLKEWWKFGRVGVGKQFFDTVRMQTFALFYASRQGWGVASYAGPPQYEGHPDYLRCG